MKKQIILQLISLLFTCFLFGQEMVINWQQCYGGSNEDHVYDIIPIDGGYFLVGSTESSNGDIKYNHGSWDAWLLKIDSNGNILWEKTFGGSDGDGCGIIIPTPKNHYYLLCASGSSDGDISYDPYPGSNDIWVVKIDSTGNIIWDKMIGSGMIDAVESATLTNDGGVSVFGWTGSQNGDVSVNYGMYDMWLVKLNSDGDIMWDKSYGTDDFDYGHVIISTSDGGFLIGGASTIGSGGNLTCEPFNLNAEAILLKLDSHGNIQWQNCYGGSGHDGIKGLLELEEGYAFVGYGSSNDGDLTSSGWHGEADIWVAKLDLYGNIIWQKCFGGSSLESALNIFKTENNGFAIWGSTRSKNGDVTNNHSISDYDYDLWYFKIDSTGELLSQSCYGGGGNDFLETGVLKKDDNNYVIAAYTDYGPSYDVACTPHGGNGDEDWWVFEIKDTTVNVQENVPALATLTAYPNPAKDYVCFEYTAQQNPEADIMIFNIMGIQISNPVLYNSGSKIIWDSRQVPPGVYFYTWSANGFTGSGKIVITK
jgi:hypothetical protein